MKILIRLALVAALAAAGAWLWTVLFPSPEEIIRAQLNQMARYASFNSPQSQLAALAAANKLSGFFNTNAQIVLEFPGDEDRTINGRDEIRQDVVAARLSLDRLKVDFPDINVTVAPDENSAVADLTIRAETDGDQDGVAEEMKFTFQKIDGQWLVTRIETVHVLT
jgi:hypothetical protein